MSGFTFAAGEPDIPVAGGARYHDRHETSLPLLVLGGIVTVCMAAQLAGSDPASLLLSDWPTAVALTIGFAVLWLTFRRRANRAGLGRPAGYGIAAIVGLAVVITPLFVVLIFAGPFVLLGSGLLIVGVKQRNRFLTIWAAVIGAIGVLEGFFGITNRLPMSVWADWEHPAIYLALGISTLGAGIVTHRRENRAGIGG